MTRVLVVEDEPDIRQVLLDALRDEGYVVDSAENGVTALQRVREAPPALAIIDLMMPGIDGRQFIRECRGDPRCAAMNFIVVSALEPSRVADLGAQAVIQKPFNLGHIIATVAEFAPLTVGHSASTP